ncbi:DHA2 family efflux MFS transporter permease subunit [Actinoplanes sp. NBC_00393]|uniref:MFS transporter n=1 Tax=Actinoplanes sp. NBC_00393 TaxID=2975953 RepID=UPI002E1E2A7C
MTVAPATTVSSRPRLLLAIACAAQFVCVLDASIVNVALPPIQSSLALDATGLQWVVSSYTLTFAGFLLLGGRVGDLWGHKRAFLAGLLLFSLASLACGFAQAGWQLIAARFVQGAGAAVLVPTTLTLVTAGVADQKARAKALSVLTAAAAAGGAFGGILGGVLTGLLSWRWVFFVNVPLGAILIAAAAWVMTGQGRRDTRGRLDLPGSIAVTTGTAALVSAVILAEEHGWAAPQTLGVGLLAVAAFAVFVLVERRAAYPIVPLGVFRIRSVTAANVLAALVSGVLPATMFFLSLYLQQVLRMDPLQAGLALTPGAIGIALGARAASLTIGRLGPRRLFVAGSLLAAAGLAWLSLIGPDDRYVWAVLPPLVLVMAGLGASGLPLTVTATSGLPAEQAGLASGLLNASKQVGSAVGLAVLVAVASAASSTGAGLLTGAVLLAASCLIAFPLAAERRPA